MITSVYLDSCCYNRPYDDQSQLRIHLESQAKMEIQSLIAKGNLHLSCSYILLYENGRKKNAMVRDRINSFIEKYCLTYIDDSFKEAVNDLATHFIEQGIEPIDSAHLASAILSRANYFITVDDGILKHKDNRIRITDPVQFIRERGENVHYD